MSEKKKIKFTVIDALVILIIVAVIGFVGYKMLGGNSLTPNVNLGADTAVYTVEYFFEEVPDFAAYAVKKGDTVTDDVRDHSLGKVVDVEVGDSVSYNADSNGIIQKSSKEGYKSVRLTTEVEAEEYEHGITISQTNYVIGHSMTLYAGNAKMYGRVASIEKK